ncbi:MAG: metallophosphoesterase family protein [Deltaproteobacteria bacterium]
MPKKILAVFLFAWFILGRSIAAAGETVVIYGDSRTNPAIHRQIIKAILRVKPSAVFHLGDFVNNGSSRKEWAEFNRIASGLLNAVKLYPAVGNHEEGSDLFFQIFKLPDNRSWYSVDCAGMHFIVLNSTEDLSKGSAQYKWLESDLSGISSWVKFRIVLMHHPLFSVGASRPLKGLRESLLPLFKKYQVAAVFTAHDHNYQRLFYGNTYYIVTGGGGAPLYSRRGNSPYLKKFVKKFHFCALSAENGILDVKVFDPGLNLIDEFKIYSAG